MCGGAILSDIIPPPRRVTAGHLWPDKSKPKEAGARARRLPRRGPPEEEDFEADFEEFVEEFDGEAKPVLPTSRSGFAGASPEALPSVPLDISIPKFSASRSTGARSKRKPNLSSS